MFQSTVAKKRIMKLRGLLWFLFSWVCLRFTRWNWKRLYHQTKVLNVQRLHVGCGNILVPGWLNLTYEKREEYGRIKTIEGAWWLNFNALNPLPIEDQSIQYLAASHFIEHLDLNEGLRFVKEAYRVMKKGGIIHLSCPDLELYAGHYIRKNKAFFDDPRIRLACTFKNAQTMGEIFIAKAYDSGGAHRWFYDAASLIHILEKAGFSQAKQITRTTSDIPDMHLIELAEREIETVYVEAKKLA